jgi:hypothetical protein
MQAKELKVVGSRVQYQGYLAWFAGLVEGYETKRLIGWKPGEHHGGFGWNYNVYSPTVTTALNKLGLTFGWWLEEDEDVLLVATPRDTIMSVGESCELCHDFAPFATNNRCNGTKFVCFSCRQGWIPPHLRA